MMSLIGVCDPNLILCPKYHNRPEAVGKGSACILVMRLHMHDFRRGVDCNAICIYRELRNHIGGMVVISRRHIIINGKFSGMCFL